MQRVEDKKLEEKASPDLFKIANIQPCKTPWVTSKGGRFGATALPYEVCIVDFKRHDQTKKIILHPTIRALNQRHAIAMTFLHNSEDRIACVDAASLKIWDLNGPHRTYEDHRKCPILEFNKPEIEIDLTKLAFESFGKTIQIHALVDQQHLLLFAIPDCYLVDIKNKTIKKINAPKLPFFTSLLMESNNLLLISKNEIQVCKVNVGDENFLLNPVSTTYVDLAKHAWLSREDNLIALGFEEDDSECDVVIYGMQGNELKRITNIPETVYDIISPFSPGFVLGQFVYRSHLGCLRTFNPYDTLIRSLGEITNKTFLIETCEGIGLQECGSEEIAIRELPYAIKRNKFITQLSSTVSVVFENPLYAENTLKSWIPLDIDRRYFLRMSEHGAIIVDMSQVKNSSTVQKGYAIQLLHLSIVSCALLPGSNNKFITYSKEMIKVWDLDNLANRVRLMGLNHSVNEIRFPGIRDVKENDLKLLVIDEKNILILNKSSEGCKIIFIVKNGVLEPFWDYCYSDVVKLGSDHIALIEKDKYIYVWPTSFFLNAKGGNPDTYRIPGVRTVVPWPDGKLWAIGKHTDKKANGLKFMIAEFKEGSPLKIIGNVPDRVEPFAPAPIIANGEFVYAVKGGQDSKLALAFPSNKIRSYNPETGLSLNVNHPPADEPIMCLFETALGIGVQQDYKDEYETSELPLGICPFPLHTRKVRHPDELKEVLEKNTQFASQLIRLVTEFYGSFSFADNELHKLPVRPAKPEKEIVLSSRLDGLIKNHENKTVRDGLKKLKGLLDRREEKASDCVDLVEKEFPALSFSLAYFGLFATKQDRVLLDCLKEIRELDLPLQLISMDKGRFVL